MVMNAEDRELVEYRTPGGRLVAREWLESLVDRVTRARLRIRLGRLSCGNLGDHRTVGEGVVELKCDFGPGYRIYIGIDGPRIIVLLCGGEKGTQSRDIRLAHEYWQDYKARKEGT